jgi:hypothetical protein
VRAALGQLTSRYSTRSLQITRYSLDRAIRHAQASDLVGRNVAALVQPPHGREGRPSKSFSLEQAKALLAAAEGTRMHAYVALSLLAAIRTEEARALRWDHVVTWMDDSTGWQPVTSAGFDHGGAGEDRFAIYVWRSQRYGGDTNRYLTVTRGQPASQLDVLPGTALAVLMVMTARCEPGAGFDVVLDIVVPRAFDGPVARNDLAWLVRLGRRRALGAAWHQRRRRLQQVLGELPLAGQQVLGEVVGAGHGTLRFCLQQVLGELPLAGQQVLGEVVGAGHGALWAGQLVREGHADRRQLRAGCPDGFGQVPDRGDHGLLALTDDGQELFLAGGASHCLGLLVSF